VQLDQLIALVLTAQALAIRGDCFLVGPRPGSVERERLVCLNCRERVEDVFYVELEVLRELADRRGPTSRAGQTLVCVTDLPGALLGLARHVTRPATVAEVASHLAEDRRHGERRERASAPGVEAIDCLEQPERGDLEQVFERLGGTAIAPREAARKRHEPL